MRTTFAALVVLVLANLLVFLHLGLHARIPVWIFSFGFTDLAIGTGLFSTAVWIPLLVEDEKEARVVLYSFWLIIGLVMWLPAFLRG